MTEKEKFQKTFGKLHASPELLTEVLNMTEEKNVISIEKKQKKYRIPKIAAAAIALALVLSSGTAVYAMDLGGVQRMVQVWIHGEQTDATLTVEDGNYSLTYRDADGKEAYQGGGGIAYEPDGTERPLTEEELLEEINGPEVVYEDDGTVWVYYKNQKLDITDKFEDGVCYVKLEDGDESQYMTIKYDNGFATSPSGYIQPWQFN